MAGDDPSDRCRDHRCAPIIDSTDGEVRRDPGGAVVSRLQRLRALLRLRFARRAAGVRLLWQHHWESVGGEDGTEKSGPADSGAGCLFWIPSGGKPTFLT